MSYYELLSAVHIRITVIWVVTSCSGVNERNIQTSFLQNYVF